ncbi:MAG: IS4 family transposase [Bacteroidota bacterium]|nr:IS4 family transposase [Bacteroidota bacterium]
MDFLPPHKNTKKFEKPLMAQILKLIPNHVLKDSVRIYQTDKGCSTYKTYDQLVAMTFGQLNKCLSLREINLGLSVDEKLIRDLNLEQSPAKSTMSDGNAQRNWKVFEHIYFELIKYYKGVFSKQEGYKEIAEIEGKSIKLIDATVMSVCLSLFDWAKYRTAKGAIKIHTSLDERTLLPDIINITEAKVSDRRDVDGFRYPEDTIIVDDRGYFDFKLFKLRIDDGNTFVTRAKSNTVLESVEELDLPEDKDHEILKDEIIYLTGKQAIEAKLDKTKLRRIAVVVDDVDRITKKVSTKTIVLISNNLTWSAATIVELYKRRWQIETFFKLIKQNLQIKNFIGVNENSNKSQIFIALITYFLIELIRRNISKVNHRFGHFVTIIRVCLLQYKALQYVANDIKIVVKKAREYDIGNLDNRQMKMNFDTS